MSSRSFSTSLYPVCVHALIDPCWPCLPASWHSLLLTAAGNVLLAGDGGTAEDGFPTPSSSGWRFLGIPSAKSAEDPKTASKTTRADEGETEPPKVLSICAGLHRLGVVLEDGRVFYGRWDPETPIDDLFEARLHSDPVHRLFNLPLLPHVVPHLAHMSRFPRTRGRVFIAPHPW